MTSHDRRRRDRAVRVRRREDRDLRLARRRASRLRAFAAGAESVPILVHEDPDPDAVAAALGVQTLLGRSPEDAPIVTLEGPTRPENRRLIELLRLPVTEVREPELYRFDRLITVDTQPRRLDPVRLRRLAVVDHHPPEPGYHAEFSDIRPEYAAASTIVAGYLRAADAGLLTRDLATALLYGIKTDSDDLTRGVSPADVVAYAFLQSRADPALLRRVERPMYSVTLMRRYGEALRGIAVENGVAAVWAGRLEDGDSHLLAELADLCLSVEGVSWVLAAARLNRNVVVTIRHLGDGPGAGELAGRLVAEAGYGGGHASMARVTWPADRLGEMLDGPADEASKALLERVRADVDALRAR